MTITPRQQQLFDYLSRYIEIHGYAPTMAEIQAHFEWKSSSTAHTLLTALEREGRISRIPHAGRGIEIIEPNPRADYDIPLIGIVSAGKPIDAVLTSETVSVPRDMLGHARTFALKVSGDSMIGEGILDGDLIIVESRQTAETGQTVVALIDDNEATVKRFYPKRRQIILEPANPRYKTIVIEPPQRVKIQGVVIAVIRRYKTKPEA